MAVFTWRVDLAKTVQDGLTHVLAVGWASHTHACTHSYNRLTQLLYTEVSGQCI